MLVLKSFLLPPCLQREVVNVVVLETMFLSLIYHHDGFNILLGLQYLDFNCTYYLFTLVTLPIIIVKCFKRHHQIEKNKCMICKHQVKHFKQGIFSSLRGIDCPCDQYAYNMGMTF